MGLELRLDFVSAEIVGEQVFDTTETGVGGGLEAGSPAR